MKYTFFDKYEFKQALKILETNPEEAKLKFEEYLSKYPEDYSTMIYYSFSLCKLGYFDKAEFVIKETEKLFHDNILLNKKDYNYIPFSKLMIAAKLKILSYQEKYEELYKLYLENINLIKEMNFDINRTIFYCKKKLGLLDPNRRDHNSYIFKQTIEYKESDFLEHIKKHLADYNIGVEEPNACIFNSTFPLTKVLEEIKKHIPSNKRLFPGDYDNLYVFKYDGCGKVNNKNTDYFSIICFHNTTDIITMFPSLDCEKLPYVDLNYINPIMTDTKVKKLSRIDRFNQRYNK